MVLFIKREHEIIYANGTTGWDPMISK